MAKQHVENFLKATSPFQFALQTKAGVEALAHVLKVLSENDEEVVVLSLDGIGAFDHVTRASFMRKLESVPELQELLPLTTALYGSASRFIWTDDAGIAHTIIQAEGGEQGCPLMPALYSLAQHDGLVEADGQLLPSELLLAFLDDLYVVTTRGRAHEAFEIVSECVQRKAGVRTHLGKLKAWSSGGGPAPLEISAIGPDVWTADKPDHLNGLVVLGTPLGKPAFVKAFVDGKIEAEKQFVEKVLKIEDIQCVWVMLSMSAVPQG